VSGTVTPSLVLTAAGSAAGVLIATCTLLILLIHKEILLTSRMEWAVRLRQALTIVVVPLLLVFVLAAGAQLLKLLR
jgi:hypothetical protein